MPTNFTRKGDGTLNSEYTDTLRNLDAACTAINALENGTATSTIPRASLSAAAGSKSSSAQIASIATTGASILYVIAPEAGTVSSIHFVGEDTLAANDTNYITFTVTNLGLAGSGTAVMLAATAANTTQATGGSAITALVRRVLTLTATGADLVVAQGDVLRLSATATGTLANAVAPASYIVRYSGTT